MRLIIETTATQQKFKQNLAGIGKRIEDAMTAAANMAASMIEDQARANAEAQESQTDIKTVDSSQPIEV